MQSVSFLNFNKIQNSVPVNFTSNPIKQTDTKDTFVRTQNKKQEETSVFDTISEINNANKKIEDDKRQIAQKLSELNSASKQYEIAKQKEKEARKLYEANCDEKHRDVLRKAFDNYVFRKNKMEVIQNSINTLKTHIQELEKYIVELNNNPTIAFLDNPDLKRDEKAAIMSENENFTNLKDLAQKLQLPPKVVQAWHKAGCFKGITTDVLNRKCNVTYIDTEDENNKEFLDEIISQIPTSLLGDTFATRYDLNEDKMKAAFQKGELKALGLTGVEHGIGTYSMLFNLEDETNKKYIETLKKTKPMKSKYYKSIGEKGALVPANYLQELGFCSVKTLRENIQNGKIKGIIQQIETPDGIKTKTLMDVSSRDRTYVVLSTLRDNNPDTVDIKKLAKELDISQARIKEAIQNDELEIIKDYLFYEDSKTLYFKKSNPKNADFINRVMFENMLVAELKAQRREELKEQNIKRLEGYSKLQSLKMTLAWNMCPNTRQIASILAKEDGYLCALLTKENEGEEELTLKEQIKVNSYRKEMWRQAGNKELSEAIKKAQNYIDTYFKDGINAVPDKSAREIIMQYVS